MQLESVRKEREKIIAKFQNKLNDNEELLCNLRAAKRNNIVQGELILTNKRVCFYRPGIFGETFETMPNDKISSVEYKSVIGIPFLTLHTSNDKLDLQLATGNKVERENFLKELESRRNASPSAVPTTTNQNDFIAQIKALAELRDNGILTDAEFEAKKVQLLDKM